MSEPTHRGGFGDFGGESAGLIERTFRERILIVGVSFPPHDDEATRASLDELELLVDTAGADVVGRSVQRRQAPDPATYVGRGKVDELADLAESLDCDTVVFDDELAPAQQANLERLLGRSAIDRTAVILDIFAQNAHSQEGVAQVQLAMFRYRLPRLRGKGRSLSQQAGGIGARRGPGETQLEIDRRRITRQIHKLSADLRTIARTRATQRKSRERSALRHVVVVGYTNAGKSTLTNRLTDADVLVEDRLFSTLDTTTRRLRLPGGETVLCSDTVGFVRRLPHELVEAFRSTLAEVAHADLVLHVVDGAAADPEAQIAAVRAVLSEIDAGELPELTVVNKADVAEPTAVRALLDAHPGAVAVSARTGAGVGDLLDVIAARLRSLAVVHELLVPYDRGDVLAALHRDGEVLVEVHTDDGTRVRARLPEAVASRLREFARD